MPMNKNKRSDITYTPLDDYEGHYYTNDIDVASMLICKKYELIDVSPVDQNKATFIFRNHPSIPDTIDGFWGNRIEVHPLEFANTRKNLKSRIFGMRKDY